MNHWGEHPCVRYRFDFRSVSHTPVIRWPFTSLESSLYSSPILYILPHNSSPHQFFFYLLGHKLGRNHLPTHASRGASHTSKLENKLTKTNYTEELGKVVYPQYHAEYTKTGYALALCKNHSQSALIFSTLNIDP